MMRSHFTATAFVVDNGRTLLHWHKKLQQWMPPGGHLLPDEDPASGALPPSASGSASRLANSSSVTQRQESTSGNGRSVSPSNGRAK